MYWIFYYIVFCVFFFFFFGLYLYIFNIIYLLEWLIIRVYSIKFRFIIYIDFITLMYLRTVFIITGIVILYRIDYINNDLYLNRFIYLVFLFIISILLIIIRPNILRILLGWDGLGLISYCLVIYYQNKNSYNSGILTVCCNRVGDIGLILIICILSYLGSWNLFLFEIEIILGLLIIIIIITKSAQIPFSLWLPAAITAPTPVSSLVHSSTLVTAGVYLLIRYNLIFINLNLNNFLLIIFRLTILISGIMANFEINFKKIIALSTLSQLGFIIRILSIGIVELGFFHLIIHAFFKSIIFIRVGGFIHINLNIQDLRMYGIIIYINSIKSLLLILSILNLCGFPFLSGFFSKDLILESLFNLNYNILNLIILYISIILTLSYSIRLLYFIIFINKNFFVFVNLGDYYYYINFVFFFLRFYSILLGFYYYIIFIKEKFIILKLDKFLILKIYIFGIYIIFNIYILNIIKYIKLIKFFIEIIYLIFFIKIIYLKLFEFIYIYEIYFEKRIEKIITLNILRIIFFLKKIKIIKILNLNFNFIIILNIYLLILLFFLFI